MTYLERLAQIESMNNPYARNPNSSAKGLYQFIDSTAQQYGINAPFGTPEYTSQEQSAIQKFTADNYAALANALGREPTDGELYLAHQQGAGGATKLLSNPQARAIDVLGQQQVLNNGGTEDMTAGDFANKWVSKFEGENTLNMAEMQPSDLSSLSDEELLKAAGLSNDISSLSDDELMKIAGVQQEPEKPGLAETVANQALQGLSFGFADEGISGLSALGAKGALELQELMGGDQAPTLADLSRQSFDQSQKNLQRQQEQRPVASALSQIGGALVTGGVGAGTKAGSALARMASNGVGKGATNFLSRVGIGAGTGATSGAVYGLGTGQEGNRADSAREGAILGAAGGAALPVAGAAASGVANAVVPKIDEAIQPLAQRARDFGIPLRLDQVSPTRARKTVQKVSQELPFSGVDAFEQGQTQAWNKAVAKTIGQEDLTPDSIKSFLSNTSKEYDNVLKDQTITFTKGDIDRLDDIVSNADLTMTDDLKAIVAKNVDKLKKDIGGDSISGEKLASFRSQLLKRIPSAPAESKQALGEVVETIDDLVEKSVPAKDFDVLKGLRRGWRNYKTLEPLLEKSTDGIVNPTQLLNRVASSPYIKASRTSVGEDDLIDLARIGKEFLPKAGGSDTFQKSAYTLGAGVGVGNPGTAVPALAGLVGNRAYQSLYNQSPKLVDYAIKRGNGSPLFLENSALRQLAKETK